MRVPAVRRLPVVDYGHLVGVVALADLAMQRAPESGPGGISVARPHN